jgi:hypothetical protein
MTHDEFRLWTKHHLTTFTGCAGWLSRFPKTARSEIDPTQPDILAAWESVLKFTDLDDARAATDALAAGEDQFSEKTGYDHHPRDVRRVARAIAGNRHSEQNAGKLRRMIDGQETFACVQCFDDGAIHCIHTKSIIAAASGKLIHPVHNPEGTVPFYECIRACTCEAGNRWRASTGTISDDDLRINFEDQGDWWNSIHAHIETLRTRMKGVEFNPDAW